MKILIFNFEYPPLGGGGGVSTQKIARELSKNHEVHIITTKPPGKLSPKQGTAETDTDTLKIHRVPVMGRKSLETASLTSMLTYVPAAWWKALMLWRKTKFDVVNAQFVLPSGIPAALIAKHKKAPFVLSLVGGDIFDPTKGISPHRHFLLRWLIRQIAKQANVCTAISNDTKRRAIELHKIKTRIVVTHLGIDGKHKSNQNRQELNLPVDEPLFVSIGRIIPRKRYDIIFKAIARVPKVRLAIIGDGPLKGSLQELARDLNIQHRIYFMGYVPEDEKINILDVADGYVSAAEHEGFGIVFLEAMESGLPIVSTWEGGQTDFLKQEKNALLVAPQDTKKIAQNIQRLMDEPSLAKQISSHNKNDVKNYYWPNVASRFEQVLTNASKHSQH